MSQKEEWTKATFRLPKSLSRRIKHLAVDLDVSDTEVFNRALEKYLKEEEKKPKVS
jgi:predicted transcriptional regulator